MNNNVIYCSRCGAEMKADSRYCMKCGNLNANHEANRNMAPYVQNQSNTYQVGGGAVVNVEQKAGDVVTNDKSGSKLACYIFNLLAFYLVVVVETGFVYSYTGGLNEGMYSLWGGLTAGISFLFLMIISLQIVFMKANRPWWLVYIPVANYFSYFKIACGKWFPGLVFILGGVVLFILNTINNSIIGIVALVLEISLFFYFLRIQGSFAKNFSSSSILYILFPFIMLPVIAFSGSVYRGVIYNDKNLSSEKDYKFRKFILSNLLLFIVAGVGITCYLRRSEFPIYIEKIKKRYYIYATDELYYEVKYRVSKGLVSCDKSNFSSDSGTYYFYYPDLGRKVHLLFYKTRESITAVVKVVIENGEAKYYISMSDDVYGYDETLYEDINIDTITYKRALDFNSSGDYNYCVAAYGAGKDT